MAAAPAVETPGCIGDGNTIQCTVKAAEQVKVSVTQWRIDTAGSCKAAGIRTHISGVKEARAGRHRSRWLRRAATGFPPCRATVLMQVGGGVRDRYTGPLW